MPVVHCKREPYDVYIGRGSKWGNMYSHRPSRYSGVIRVATREEAIARYRCWLWEEIGAGRIDLKELVQLHGKTLGCWCSPQPCHGEVLMAASMWALGEQARRVARVAADLAVHA